MFISFITVTTVNVVTTKVRIVVMIQIKINIPTLPFTKEYLSIIATPEGTKKKAILVRRNSQISLIECGLMTLVISNSSKSNILIRLAGKLKGSSNAIASPARHRPKMIQSCFSKFIFFLLIVSVKFELFYPVNPSIV